MGKGWSVRKISLEGLFLQEGRGEEKARTKRFSRFTLVYFQSNFVTSRNDVEERRNLVFQNENTAIRYFMESSCGD